MRAEFPDPDLRLLRKHRSFISAFYTSAPDVLEEGSHFHRDSTSDVLFIQVEEIRRFSCHQSPLNGKYLYLPEPADLPGIRRVEITTASTAHRLATDAAWQPLEIHSSTCHLMTWSRNIFCFRAPWHWCTIVCFLNGTCTERVFSYPAVVPVNGIDSISDTFIHPSTIQADFSSGSGSSLSIRSRCL